MIAMPSKTCLSDQELADFRFGRLTTDRFQSLLTHLDNCESCQRRAETDSSSADSMIISLAMDGGASAGEEAVLAEADCQAALYHASQSPAMRYDSVLPPIETLGPYRLLRPLGRGGMGAVYLAEHVRLRKKCAIKLLPRERCFDADWLARFEREMQAVASLQHSGIVTATDAGEVDGWHYLVMEYLDGLDLAALVRRTGPISIDTAAKIMRDVCHALAAIHDAGLVHRDVKPSNVMLTRAGQVKLLDLGLVLDGQTEAEMRLTTVGHVIGTLAFAAPEQLANGESVDARTDLYGIGATLFQLIAGSPAHTSDRGIGPLVIEKTSRPAKRLKGVRPDTPDELDDLVAGLLDRDPDARPKSATAVASELDRYASTASLKPLAVKALRLSDADETSSQFGPASIPSSWQTAAAVPPRRRGIGRWVAWAGLPVALLAAIVLTIQTDRGTLVIESPTDDLDVSILQDGEPIEAMEVATGENQTTLRSGRYTVRLDTPSDRLTLTDNSVVVSRGDRTVLKIREQTDVAPATAGAIPDQKVYQGKPLSYWTTMVRKERDVFALREAMFAIASLADADDVDAAHPILIAARRFGGWAAKDDGSKLSYQYMRVFNETFSRMMPQPGIAAITRELPIGNERSRAASLRALSLFPELFAWADRPQNEQAATELHQAMRELLQHPDQIETEPNVAFLRQLSLTLALALDAPLTQEPGLAAWLKEQADSAAASSGSMSVQPGGELSPAQVIATYRLDVDLPPSVAVAGLLSQSGLRDERNEIYLRELRSQPTLFADATLRWLETLWSSNFGPNPVAVLNSNEPLWMKALPIIARETTRPGIAANLLQQVNEPQSTGPGMSAYDDVMGGGMGGLGRGFSVSVSHQLYAVVQEAIEVARARLSDSPTSEDED